MSSHCSPRIAIANCEQWYILFCIFSIFLYKLELELELKLDGKLLLLEISKSHNCSSVRCLKCVQFHNNGIAHIIESVQNVSCFSAVFFRRAVEIEPIENVVVSTYIHETCQRHSMGCALFVLFILYVNVHGIAV